jgi:hypothetical protein
MKYWLVVLIGGFCSANVWVAGTSIWRDGNIARQELASAQRTVDAAHSADPDQILFEGWADPEFALLVSGRLDGYIEPCGCTGLENQKGGLLRRHTFLKQLTNDRGWKVACLDTGNQVNRTGVQSVIKLKTTWRGLFHTMGYQVGSIGVDDLKTPSIELLATYYTLNLDKKSPFVCANFNLMDSDPIINATKVILVGDHRIGVTAVLGDEEIKRLSPVVDTDAKLFPVDVALPKAVADLENQHCDVNVLIVNSSLEEARRLANRYSMFDLVISANGVGDPTNAPEKFENNGHITSLIQAGSKGMHVGVVGFYRDGPRWGIRYQRVPMDHRFEDADEMKVVFTDYQVELGRMTLEDLRIAPKPHPTGRRFVGSEKCMDCHEYAYTVWEEGHLGDEGPHFRATLDLNDGGQRAWVKRDRDPECLSCHVTGWNPQGYFPYETGFTNIDDADQDVLHGNGCENCHGPGSAHVEAEEADPKLPAAALDAERKNVRVTLDQARKELCYNCHDLDNSPGFQEKGAFERYWPLIDHSNATKADAKKNAAAAKEAAK